MSLVRRHAASRRLHLPSPSQLVRAEARTGWMGAGSGFALRFDRISILHTRGEALVTYGNVALILAWAVFAMWQLPARGHFAFDEAYFYEQSVRVSEGQFPIYGPFISGDERPALTP